MSWLSNLLNPGGGYKQAEQQSKQYYDQAQSGLSPYNQTGQEAGGDIMSMLQKLMNPEQLQNEWSKGYETSPYAQQMMEQAKTSGLDAASSMGLMGSSGALQNIQSGASNIMQGDRQNYLNDLMQKYQAGLNTGQSMYGTGAGAASQMGQNAMNQGNNMANLAFGKYNAGPSMMGKGAGGLLSMLQEYLTGGMGQGDFGRGSWAPKNPYQNGGY